MAVISNVNMSITKGVGGNKRSVTVSYRITFSPMERTARSTFTERVTLRGQDAISDDHQYEFHVDSVRADPATSFVDRSFTADVPRSALDEDRDFVWSDRDELYARVMLTPFVPMSAQGDSNVITGNFGSMGSD